MLLKQQMLRQAHTSNSLVLSHLAKEERAGCFTLIVLWLSVFSVSSSRSCVLVCIL